MDEIDFLKKVFKMLTISVAVMVVFTISMLILTGVDRESILYTLAICSGIYVGVIVIYYILKLIFTSQFSLKYKNNKELYRNILTMYPPAIYSFLYNKKTESYTDYTATILNLECKKYLKINSINSGEYDIVVLSDNLDNLYEHEKYVMNCIMKNTKFNMSDFNQKIIMDMQQLDLISIIDDKEKKEHNVFKPIIENKYFQIISTILIIILFLYLGVFHLQIIINILMCCCIIGCIAVFNILEFSMSLLIKTDGKKSRIKLTKEGKKIRNYAFGLKKFLNEYTLISEREIKYKELFDNYIAYALSLGEAKIVEEFVSNNKKYRNLIYKS